MKMRTKLIAALGLSIFLASGLSASAFAAEGKSPGGESVSGANAFSLGDKATRTVCFNSALSSISYKGSVETGGDGLPDAGGEVWYLAENEDGTDHMVGRMTRGSGPGTVSGDSGGDDDHLFYAQIPVSLSRIRFGPSEESVSGASSGDAVTAMTSIDTSLEQPCFFALTRDPSVYDGGMLTGKWIETGSVLDPESVSGNSLEETLSGSLADDPSTIYLSSDIYDYFTDYELTGQPVSTCPADASLSGSHRSYLRYRAFDTAASDYYQSHLMMRPIYQGHFQPESAGGSTFSGEVKTSLPLFGLADESSFFTENNSLLDMDGNGGCYADAARGLVPKDLSDMASPYFDEAFLKGANAKDTVLGNVMHGVLFPFTLKDQEDADGNPTGVRAWTFDSARTTLHLAEDGSQLFLKKMRDDTSDPDGTEETWSYNIDSTGFAGSPDLSSLYGFFPLNDTSIDHNSFHYNYGFGTRIDIPFTVPDNGNIEMSDGSYVPQTFSFSGDDDVWVFIDGKLVLDMGGMHGRVNGCINFSKDFPFTYAYDTKSFADDRQREEYEVPEASVYISGTKADASYPDDGGPCVTSFDPSDLYSGTHTMTFLYLERGMWESNLSVAWTFVPEPVNPKAASIVLPDTGGKNMDAKIDFAVAVLALLVTSTTVTMRLRPDKEHKWRHEFSISNHPGIRAFTKFINFLRSRKDT